MGTEPTFSYDQKGGMMLPKPNNIQTEKYVAGMINPYDQKSMMAANADDKFEAHLLSESGIIDVLVRG